MYTVNPGLLRDFLMEVCCLVLKILTLFKPKSVIFTLFSHLASKIHTRFQTWPLDFVWQGPVTNAPFMFTLTEIVSLLLRLERQQKDSLNYLSNSYIALTRLTHLETTKTFLHSRNSLERPERAQSVPVFRS